MKPSFSRRAFLEGAAATVGVALLPGCGGSNQQLQAKAQGNGFLISGAQLPKQGEAVLFAFPDASQGLLFRAQGGEAGAVSAVCTHQGCIVQWTDGNPQAPFACPCHQSKFDLNGRVLGGPAKAPLAHFQATQNGNDVELKSA